MLAWIALGAMLQTAEPSTQPASKSAKAELAGLQRMRDSLVAARWESRRVALSERDDYESEFVRVRDSLEDLRQERAARDVEARRILRQQVDVVAEPTPAGDPYTTYRRPLAERMRVLLERMHTGFPMRDSVRMARVDSLLNQLAEGDPNPRVAPALRLWRQTWSESGAPLEVAQDAPLPRSEGEPLRGALYRFGNLGGWYRSTDGKVMGALLRSGPEGAWEWREDLSDSARLAISTALNSPSAADWILPFDPGQVTPEGPGFFAQTLTWKDRLGGVLSFQKGPLHALALWAARASMLLLLLLGGWVLWAGWTRHRALIRQEQDGDTYGKRLLEAYADRRAMTELADAMPDTPMGRMVRSVAASRHLSPDALEQVLSAEESAEARRLDTDLGRLGTIGANAPFIGLFGTVCGVLDAFAALGRTGGGPQSVMAAIAEALVATAVGLLVAIPAVWIYNALQERVRHLLDRVRELKTIAVAAALEASVRSPSRDL